MFHWPLLNRLTKFAGKRRDQQHAKLLRRGGARPRRSRRLTLEQCEPRLVLSGSPLALSPDLTINPELAVNVASASNLSEGGFLVLDSTSFLHQGDHLFVAGDSTDGVVRIAEFSTGGQGQSFNFVVNGQDLDLSHNLEKYREIIDPPKTVTHDAGSLNDLGTTVEIAQPTSIVVDSGTPVAKKPTKPTLEEAKPQEQAAVDPTEKVVDEKLAGGEELVDLLAVESDTFSGTVGSSTLGAMTPEALRYAETTTFAQVEGGSLEVAQVVHQTQRAYETRLSAVIASNLDRDGQLPLPVPTQAKPVVGELARAMVFEVVAEPAIEATDLEPVAVQAPNAPAELTSSNPTLTSAGAEQDSERTVSRAADANAPENSLTRGQRLDDERLAARATTFAEWPLLATVVASYLLVERRGPSESNTVQPPPRRSRRNSLS